MITTDVRAVYAERNLLALALAATTADGCRLTWDASLPEEDRAMFPVAYFRLGGRQVSWHIHIDDLTALGFDLGEIEPDSGMWDGHTKEDVLAVLAVEVRRMLGTR